tara:strand:+ start:43 stop:375 length:333 start_codon:yes stop_codon:yes gene_type:complete
MSHDVFDFTVTNERVNAEISRCDGSSMDGVAEVLNDKVKARLEECLKWLGVARQELQEENKIPTTHVMSRGATLAIQEIEEVEYGLNGMLAGDTISLVGTPLRTDDRESE